jgi:hypothetical protein
LPDLHKASLQQVCAGSKLGVTPHFFRFQAKAIPLEAPAFCLSFPVVEGLDFCVTAIQFFPPGNAQPFRKKTV